MPWRPLADSPALEESACNHQLRTITELNRVLRRPASLGEGMATIRQFLPRLLSAAGGALFLVDDEEQPLRLAFEWGDPPAPADETAILPSRLRGRLDPRIDEYGVGIPLHAGEQPLGFLRLRCAAGEGETLLRSLLTISAVEQLALAIANLRWRESLREQSIRDPLSGLYNRRYLEASMMREVARAERARARRRNTGLAVLMLDVDNFKRFNDEHGHEAGDLVIAEIGALLRRLTRTSDIASRYGGEEFVVVLTDVRLERAVSRAEEIRAAVSELELEQHGEPLPRLTTSIGVAMYPRHGDSVETLIRAADAAMYVAKHGGRNQVRSADQDTALRPPS